MSHELFELFGMLGAGVGLSALFHRALQPLLLRLATRAASPLCASARRGNACGGNETRHGTPSGASRHPLDSPI